MRGGSSSPHRSVFEGHSSTRRRDRGAGRKQGLQIITQVTEGTNMVAATQARDGYGQGVNLPFIIGASSVGTLIEWYDFYLYGVLALFFSKHFFSPEHEPDARAHRQPLRVLDRVPGSALRRHRLRSSRGPDRPQVHVHADLAAHGRVDLRRRPAAGYATIGALAPILLVAMRVLQGLALGRRIWRRRNLHRRALARPAPRLLHVVDPDDGDDGHRPGAAGDPAFAASTSAIRPSATGAGACRS